MAKTRKSDHGQDKITKNIQRQYDTLFSEQDTPPTHMNITQVEALKARVAELEEQLNQQPTPVGQTRMTFNETVASPSPDQTNHKVFQGTLNKVAVFLNHLSYPRKFIIISFLFLLPLLVFYPLVNEQVQHIKNYGYQELRGADYLYALVHLLNDVQTYQIEAGRFYLDEISSTDLQASETEVELSLQKFTQVHARNGMTLGLGNEPSQLSAEWEAIKRNVAQRQAMATQQTQFVEDIQELIFKVGNNSYLILDPDLDTYYTMDAVLLKIPENQTLLFQILTLSNEATRAHKLTPEQSAELTSLIGRLSANLKALNTNIGVAIQTNKSGQMQPLIEAALSDYSASMLNFLDSVEQQVIAPPNISADPETLLTDGQQMMSAQENFYDSVSQALQIGIQERINALTSRLILGLSLVFITAVVAFVIGLSIMRAISRPLQSLTSAAQRLATGDMGARAKVLSGDEVGQTAAAFNTMADRLGQTLTALTDRTRDLTLATEVSQRISEVRDIEVILTEAVELIQNRFDLYYAQVYLLDNARQNLILRAGTGEAGQKLIERGFHLPVNTASLNGVAVMEQRVVIISDTAQSASFRPNPLLPNTRSEMCLPLHAGDQLLGVLDLQSEHPGTFSQDALPVFNALVGQLTIALQNAALYAQAQEAQSDLEAQIRGMTENGWQEFLNAIERSEQLSYAFHQEKVISVESSQSIQNDSALTVPISIIGAEVGMIQLAKNADTLWTENESQVAQATADLLARHIENLRLLAQSEQYRFEAEQVSRRLTREGWDSFFENRDHSDGYIYDLNQVRPFSGNGNHQSEQTVKQSLVVRNETIGELAVDNVNGAGEEAAQIVAAIANQLSGHIENLRLLEQTQQRTLELEETQTFLDSVIESLPHMLFVKDAEDLRFLRWNKAAEELVGFSQEAMLGKNDYDFFPKEEADFFTSKDREVLAGGKTLDIPEETLATAHRGMRYMHTRKAPIYGVDGKPKYLLGVAEDITERKKSEEVIRLAHQRAQIILESVTIPMVITRVSDNHLTFVNPPAIEVTQFNYEEVINQPAPDFYANLDDRKKFITELRATGLVSNMSVQLRRSSGEAFWAMLSARIFDYQGQASILTTFMDITDRIRAQESVAKRAAELQTVAEVSTTTATTLEPDRLLQIVVDLTKEQFGLYHAHIYLVNESWNTLLLAAGAGEVGRKLVAEEHAIPMNLEQSLVARASRERSSIIVNDVKNEPGFLPNPLLPETLAEMAVPMIVGDKVLGVFDVQSNNPQGFSAEDASIYTTLASQVAVALQNARLYVEQAATVTQLRELDRLKSSFLANMSHELRTPLNSILGFTDVMLEGLDGNLTDYMDNDLHLIQKNGQHLLHLINDVLDMAKIESGRMNLNPEKFKVHHVLDEVVNITSTLASEKNLSLFIDENSDQEIEIYADNTRLRQVMINLVNNSIKFTEKGRISICTKPLEGARVLITVKDTGIGIPPDKLESVFQEFTQVDTSTTRKVGGTGLGLPISRRLVEMHGGRLWAESTGIEGEGTTFYVELPLEAQISEMVEKQEK